MLTGEVWCVWSENQINTEVDVGLIIYSYINLWLALILTLLHVVALTVIWAPIYKQEAFEKCWAHSPLRAAARPNFTLPFTRCRYTVARRHCRTPPAHRCPRRRRQQQRQRVTGDRYGPMEWAQWWHPSHCSLLTVSQHCVVSLLALPQMCIRHLCVEEMLCAGMICTSFSLALTRKKLSKKERESFVRRCRLKRQALCRLISIIQTICQFHLQSFADKKNRLGSTVEIRGRAKRAANPA